MAEPSGAEGKWSWNPEVITTCLSGRLSNGPRVDVSADADALSPSTLFIRLYGADRAVRKTVRVSVWRVVVSVSWGSWKEFASEGCPNFPLTKCKEWQMGFLLAHFSVPNSFKYLFNEQLCTVGHWWRHSSFFAHQTASLPLRHVKPSQWVSRAPRSRDVSLMLHIQAPWRTVEAPCWISRVTQATKWK